MKISIIPLRYLDSIPLTLLRDLHALPQEHHCAILDVFFLEALSFCHNTEIISN